jgi:Fur family transcriptional regulator, ferric uptake regulator
MPRVSHRRWLTEADRRLRDAGLRVSAGRTAVVELLAREGRCLLTAQEISDRLRARGGVGSTATVYRALETLHELGLVHRFVDGRGGVAHYEIADPSGEHHHHLVDDDTGEITEFTDALLERAIEELGRRLGVELRGHDVVLHVRRPGGGDG